MAAFAAPVFAADDCVSFKEGWIRLPPMASMPMAAGFGQVHNACAAPVAVTAARGARFAEVSLHESTVVDGVNRMREVERLPVAAGKEVAFKPGGLHLMLMGIKQPLQDGQRVALTLVLEDGREVPAELVVKKQGG